MKTGYSYKNDRRIYRVMSPFYFYKLKPNRTKRFLYAEIRKP
jgi:hypothetical protein